jgi:hypothetical protein
MLRLISTIAVVLLAVGCTKQIKETTRASKQEEAEFVNAFLKEEYKETLNKNKYLLINPDLSIETYFSFFDNDKEKNKECEKLVKEANRIDPKIAEAFKDFLNANKFNDSLSHIAPITVKYKVLTKEMILENTGDSVLATRETCQRFWDKTKTDGLITLSHPGFSTDKTVAVIYTEHYWDPLAGSGGMQVYRKNNGVWKKTDISFGPKWVS